MKIILGVTGGIAAYKAIEVLRILTKRGHRVICCLTMTAQRLIGVETFKTLSKNKVITDLFSDDGIPEHIKHQDADVVAIVPATYNIIGKVAAGIADDPLTTIISAAKGKVIFFPAMNTVMWENKILQQNIEKLRKLGYYVIEPEEGELAEGKGKGRLPSPDKIAEEIERIGEGKLKGKKILVTAGATEEYIDPVRCITNRSSGKMGIKIAEEVKKEGADVLLICGRTEIQPPSHIPQMKIRETKEMKEEILKNLEDKNIVIMTAAICDFKPVKKEEKKIKRKDRLTLEFEKTEDITIEIRRKKKDVKIVGFALESENLIENAKKKLKEKELDIIVANSIETMGSDFIRPVIIKGDEIKEYDRMRKEEFAKELIKWLTLL